MKLLYSPNNSLLCIRCLNLYKPGSGLKSVKEVLEPKPSEERATWETHTMLGQKREDLFHYTDRNAGKGYTNFRQSPYPNRPYIFPVARGPGRNMLILTGIALCFMMIDEEWVNDMVDQYMEKKLGYTFTSLLPENRTPKAMRERERECILQDRQRIENQCR